MAIAFGSAGTAVDSGTGSTTITLPTFAAGDVCVVQTSAKYGSRSYSAISGWTFVGSTSAGLGTDGVSDEGTIIGGAFYREMDGTESSSLTVTMTGGTANSLHARGYVFTKAGGATWSLANGGAGLDNSAGTTCSFTYASDPGVEANDWLVTVWFVNTDLYTHGTHALTATGLSSITTASRGNSAVTQGADMRCGLVTHVIGAGPSSDVATYSNVASGSTASAPTGGSVIIRLREVAGSGTVLPLFMHNYRQRRSA